MRKSVVIDDPQHLPYPNIKIITFVLSPTMGITDGPDFSLLTKTKNDAVLPIAQYTNTFLVSNIILLGSCLGKLNHMT
jgi:hypothetical protein